MSNVFFESWESVLRVVITSVVSYTAMVFLLRVSGKRTLSKMNAFDLVVTVALGSLLATAILDKNVTLADGITGFAMIIVLQLVVTWISVRSKNFSKLIKAQPVLLYYDGQYYHSNMKKERVLKNEILSALRKQGIASLEDVKAVVLETDSSITVLKKDGKAPFTSLENMKR